jgi:hypothetical protein
MSDPQKRDAADALAAMTGGAVRNDVEAPLGGDFSVAAPAPDPSVFAPKHSTRDLLLERRIHTRRTLIPILLTVGVLMPLVGGLKWLRGSDSPFAAWPLWAPVVLFLCGLLLLTLGYANMMQVRQMMRRISLPDRR